MPNSDYEVRQLLKKTLKSYQKAPLEMTARMGSATQGDLYPDPNNVNIIWCRDANGVLKKVYNQRIPNVWDLAVKIGYTADQPRLLQVLRIDNSYGTTPPYPAIPPGMGQLLQWPGPETLLVKGEQIQPALVVGNNGFILTIYPCFFLKSDGTWGYLAPNADGTAVTLDVTSSKPTTGAIACLLSVKDDGTLVLTNGSIKDTPELITSADFPKAPDATYHPIAAMRLYSGQTVIRQEISYTDLFDLRWLSGNAGGSSLGSLNTYWIITPPIITTDLNDWTPTGYITSTRTIKISADVTHNITGLTGGTATLPQRRLVVFENIGNVPIVFKDENGGSAAANQFWNAAEGAVDVTLQPGEVIRYQYDIIVNLWTEIQHTTPGNLIANKLVDVDALGVESEVDWLSIRPDSKQLILGTNEVGIPGGGGVVLHIMDETGYTGGECFLWAFGVGTSHPGFPDSDFCGRYFFVRGGGTEPNPTGVLDGWELGELIGFGFGDNGQYNATGESGQAEVTNRVKIAFRAVGNFTDTSRATQIEFWAVPTGSLVKQLIATFDPTGINLPSGENFKINGVPITGGSGGPEPIERQWML